MDKVTITLDLNDVAYSWDYDPSEVPVRGNAVASGDDTFDRECENRILADLANGEDYAWCDVVVKATLGPFVGVDSLCAVSVHKESDLESMIKEYGMRENALTDLTTQIKAAGSVEN